MIQFKPLPPLEVIDREYLYDPETGIFRHKRYKCGSALANAVAGCAHPSGYIRLKFDGAAYLAHRIAWKIYYRKDPGHNVVDHIDRNIVNNKISNLRLASRRQNACNRVSKGYSKCKNKWKAYIRHNGNYIHLGVFATAEEAHAAHAQKALELREEFAPLEYQDLILPGSPQDPSRAT